MLALQSLMSFAVDSDLPTTVPPQLLQDLACVRVRYTQHASMTEQLGGPGVAHLDDIIKRYNQHFSGQQKLQLHGMSEAIGAVFSEDVMEGMVGSDSESTTAALGLSPSAIVELEKKEALKLQDQLAMDTINISLGCMNPGSTRQKEPRQAAVDKEVWKRKPLDSKALA